MQQEVINKTVNQFNEVIESIGQAKETITKELEISEKYIEPFNDFSNPFNDFKREFQNSLKQLKKDVALTILSSYKNEYTPNLIIRDEELIKEYIDFEHFDIKPLIRAFIKQYVKSSERLSIKQIRDEAKKLLPVIWDNYKRRETTIKDILKGNILKLKKYVEVWDFDNTVHLYESSDLTAFEKLVKIVSNNANPTDVISYLFVPLLQIREAKVFFKEHKINNTIDTVRFYKNGRLDIKFYSEQDARKVAEVLVKPQNPKEVK